MNIYTLYCTEEQTRKALELGAPLEIHIIPATIIKDNEKLVRDVYCIDEKYYVKPTAEQMIGWLEEREIFIEYVRVFGKYAYRLLKLHGNGERNLHIQQQGFNTYKDAVLSAIDVALDYLTKN